MGYRHYLYEVDKNDLEKINEDTVFEQVFSMEPIFEFGKLYEGNIASELHSLCSHLFEHDDYSDILCMKADIKMIEKSISYYKQRALDYYTKQLKKDDSYIKELFIDEIKNIIANISDSDFVKIDTKTYNITGSWNYMFAVFNLAFIAKTFDFENKQLLLVAY